MKKFDVPTYFRSSIIASIKGIQKLRDPRKQDFSPTEIDLGKVVLIIPRHFGFCYGVENAIEIAYKTIHENPNKRIFLLSEIIHNPHVNKDLNEMGIRFIQDNEGNQLIDWNEITKDDIVITPAFGTTKEIESKVSELGVDLKTHNTTCPFVEKVWNKATKLGNDDYTVIIHGKHEHEETKATFSHTNAATKAVIVKNIEEAQFLGDVILGKKSKADFYALFESKFSVGFDPDVDLVKIGVVNQTTMLATETQEIAEYLRNILIEKYGSDEINSHYSDTRDTLCYATNDNQSATLKLLENGADLAFVIGGYNSSNTSHLFEILEAKFPSYFISSADSLIDDKTINHFNLDESKIEVSQDYLPKKEPLRVIITSGASCPDSVVNEVISKLLSFLSIDEETFKNTLGGLI